MDEETDVLRVTGGTTGSQLQSLHAKDTAVGDNMVIEVGRGYCDWHFDDVCRGKSSIVYQKESRHHYDVTSL